MFNLSKRFKEFSQLPIFSDEIQQISIFLSDDSKSFDEFKPFTQSIGIDDLEQIKSESVQFLLAYAEFILTDGYLSEPEFKDFQTLKKVFRIDEGDFYDSHQSTIQEILKKQFIRLYSDFKIDPKEEIEMVNLQALFDLSYDQFEAMKEDQIIQALENGAHPKDLDIASLPEEFRASLKF